MSPLRRPIRGIALIEELDTIERILKHLKCWRISYRPPYRANVCFGSIVLKNSVLKRAAISFAI